MSVRRRRSISIGLQVWAMVIVCLGLLTALLVVNTQAQERQDRKVAGNELRNRGEATARYLADGYDESEQQPLLEIARQPAIRRGGEPCVNTLTTLQSGLNEGYADVVDGRGRVLCSGIAEHLAAGRPYAENASLLTAVRKAKVAFDAPFRDPFSGALSTWLAVPVPSRGAPPRDRRSLVFVMETQHWFAPDDTDARFESLVLDPRGNTVLMRWPMRDGTVGSSLTRTELGAVVHSDGVTAATGLDDVRRIYRSVPIEGTRFRLLVGIDESEAYAPARAGLRRNMLFAGVFVLVVSGLGLLLYRRVARPARRLRHAIDRVRVDEAAPPAPETGPAELAEVATAFNAMVDARRAADGRFRAIVQHNSDYVLVIDRSGIVTYAAPAASATLGVDEGTTAAELLDLVHLDDRRRAIAAATGWMAGTVTGSHRQELRLVLADGEERFVEVVVQNLLDDTAVGGMVLTGRDITERKHFEQHLAHQARHDPLTGLANRTAVVDRLSRLLQIPAQGATVATLFIDLDRFKLVNDSHGHPVGDQLLIALSRRLEACVRPGDLVGRFGGDEFVIVAANIAGEQVAVELAKRAQQALTGTYEIEGRELYVSGSIGIALARRGDTPDALLRNADMAMYQAKDGGRDCFALYDEEMRQAAVQELHLQTDLHRALERSELVLHYQPVISLDTGRVTGAEALVRWRHPERGLISPAEFIPAAEDTGLIVPIGEWVLREAAWWAARTSEEAGLPLRVSVNVSARQLAQPDFLEMVDDVLLTSGLPATQLCLEMTESLLVGDAATADATFGALRERGVHVSIDDFGTGYSSLSYLQRFSVDEVKLDRGFVASVGEDETTATIVGSIVGMAHAVGLEVTAEGVERGEQLAFLRAIGCDRVQGYFFAKPREGTEVAALFAEQRSWSEISA